jgi:hypothetical protein
MKTFQQVIIPFTLIFKDFSEASDAFLKLPEVGYCKEFIFPPPKEFYEKNMGTFNLTITAEGVSLVDKSHKCQLANWVR